MTHPSKIGRYHVIGRIAAGGMAEIFLAKVLGPGGFERPVVIKRVLPHLLSEREFRDMFMDEARIVAAIHHRNVVQVHELGREDHELYLVMEYLAGESVRSLTKRIAARGVSLDLGLCAHIVAEACAGLHAAHDFTGPNGKSLSVVHRDVCPNNLFVSYDGNVKVVDFGIAQAVDRFTMTEAGQVKGKAAYMSPEQCLRKPVDRRTDVFALGVVLYELTTGHRLFGGALESRILSCIRGEEVQPPSSVVSDYPAELEQICMRALRFDPEERYATAEDMRVALVRYQRSRGSDTLPEHALKTCMHDLFSDRISEKADMLNRLQRGSGVSSIPTAEISEIFAPPVVETDRAAPDGKLLKSVYADGLADGARQATDASASKRRRMKQLGWRVGVAVAATVGLALLGSLAMTPPAHGARTSPPMQVEQLAAKQAVAPTASAPTVEQVTVDLTSKPLGARVWIDRAYHGVTPVSVSLPRSGEAVRLRLVLPGHDALEQTLVPDVDQRFSFSLTPSPSLAGSPSANSVPAQAPRRRAAKSAPTSKPSAEKEFFLFE